MRMRSWGLVVMVAGVSGSAAWAHEGDIGIRIAGGRLETVLAGGEPPMQTFGTEIERVFAAELAWNPVTSEVVIDEPGLASIDTGLVGQALGFNLRAALRQWNGSSFVATSRTMSVGGGDLGLSNITTPASDVLTAGHAIVVPRVPLDFHFDWRLDGATETVGQGVYLVEIELTNPGGAIGRSDPLWIVYNWGESELVHEEAIEYAVSNVVPTPSVGVVMMMMAAGGVMGIGRRRR